jgi:hypothetical protein
MLGRDKLHYVNRFTMRNESEERLLCQAISIYLRGKLDSSEPCEANPGRGRVGAFGPIHSIVINPSHKSQQFFQKRSSLEK